MRAWFLLVGLGNPGSTYTHTRHNIGWQVLDELAARHALTFRRSEWRAQFASGQIGGRRVLLAKPQRYMNQSGGPTRSLLRYYKVETARLLVVCDHLDLPLGMLRLRAGGGAGGQKGLRDIHQQLGTQEIAQLRLGIGRPPGKQDPAAYVLRTFDESERILHQIVLERAADCAGMLARRRGRGRHSALQRFGGGYAAAQPPAAATRFATYPHRHAASRTRHFMLSGALTALRRAAAYHDILNAPPNQAIRLRRAARPAIAAALAQDSAAPTLILTAQPARAREWEAQLPSWSSAPVFRFATPTARPYERVGRNGPSAQKRLAALVALIPSSPVPAPILIASASALMTPTLPPTRFRAAVLRIAPGERQPLRALLQHLLSIGYEAVPLVVSEGQFARRGGIIDVFPIAADSPLRVELDDDRIASLRRFDPVNQRSTSERVTAAHIPPAREFLPADGPPIARDLATWLERNDLTAADALATASPCPTLEFYLPYAGPPASLLDHLPPCTRILIEEPEELSAQFAHEERVAQARRADAILPPGYPVPYLSGETLSAPDLRASCPRAP